MEKPTGLAKEQDRALDLLKRVPAVAEGFYLAGGSALAWHLRHRRSNDLDFFSLTPSVGLEGVRRGLAHGIPAAVALSSSDVAMKVRLGDTMVDFVSYPYPPLDAPRVGPRGFPVAGVRDLAAMKVATIASRGLRRDFWDLFAILDGPRMTLQDAVESYRARFGLTEAASYHVMRALTFFEDAERDPLWPQGLTSRKWASIKRFFTSSAPLLLDVP
ncbi:MAG: hypothetical protein EXR72_10995 [Myxococcales bacterium]|nr:hypothetical protein [Myxococcales bacterium]